MDRLATGHRDGHWVCLENIHLMPRWCSVLEKKLDDYAIEGSHPDFRVFLTAEPAKLPIGLLERSIKLTNEPPQGLKQNLKRAFATFDKDEFEFKDAKVKSILFVMCHFHSIIVERIKFGPKGWNRGYPFNTGDLMNSSDILSNYLESGGDKIPWKDLRYMFGEIMYGGHITDDWDRLLCATYLEFYIKEELLDEMELFPYAESHPDLKFRSPPVLAYDQYVLFSCLIFFCFVSSFRFFVFLCLLTFLFFVLLFFFLGTLSTWTWSSPLSLPSLLVFTLTLRSPSRLKTLTPCLGTSWSSSPVQPVLAVVKVSPHKLGCSSSVSQLQRRSKQLHSGWRISPRPWRTREDLTRTSSCRSVSV